MGNISHELAITGTVGVSDQATGVTLKLEDSGAIPVTSEDIKVLTDTLLMYMAAVLEKMPRVTGNDQCAVVAEGGTISTVSTVTTCGTVTNMTNFGTRAGVTTADALIMNGTSHIYNNIIVS